MTGKKTRTVQCFGRVKLGPTKGDRCRREKRMPVDKNDNTKQWFCTAHRKRR